MTKPSEVSWPSDASWSVHYETADFVNKRIAGFLSQLAPLKELSDQVNLRTGTRLIDWVDHLSLADEPELGEALSQFGFSTRSCDDATVWDHQGGIFPTIRVTDSGPSGVTIKVDSVADYLFAHGLSCHVDGPPFSTLRTAVVAETPGCRMGVIERRGSDAFTPEAPPTTQIDAALRHAEAFRLRQRTYQDPLDGFAHAHSLIDLAIKDLGVDWASALFFEAERAYWQRRNRAARLQKQRQDELGLGWANHDHHTYRSSRDHFQELIALLEKLGLSCRERFYGGREAGWGAQVLEQPVTGVVVFADVDLSPEEVMGDFAHEGLSRRDQLGTVGLWCCLHGEAMLEAGMHHLECQFDFDRAREQLAALGIDTMPPFTDLPELKQAFTEGELWPVLPQRIRDAVKKGQITSAQAERFQQRGCLGSHLEILERHGGYRGFNQSGISEIIRQTDPRRSASHAPSAE